MKCKQPGLGFELESQCPFSTTITITPQASSYKEGIWVIAAEDEQLTKTCGLQSDVGERRKLFVDHPTTFCKFANTGIQFKRVCFLCLAVVIDLSHSNFHTYEMKSFWKNWISLTTSDILVGIFSYKRELLISTETLNYDSWGHTSLHRCSWPEEIIELFN